MGKIWYSPQTDADIFLRRPGGGKQARLPGNREKLSDRIYKIVQDLFFFRKALMKNVKILLILSNTLFP